jgi:hypothetical protein
LKCACYYASPGMHRGAVCHGMDCSHAASHACASACPPLQGQAGSSPGRAAAAAVAADPTLALVLARHNSDLAHDLLEVEPTTDITWPEPGTSPAMSPRNSGAGGWPADSQSQGEAGPALHAARRSPSPIKFSMFNDDGDVQPAAKLAAKAIVGAAAAGVSAASGGSGRRSGPVSSGGVPEPQTALQVTGKPQPGLASCCVRFTVCCQTVRHLLLLMDQRGVHCCCPRCGLQEAEVEAGWPELSRRRSHSLPGSPPRGASPLRR